MVSEGARSDYPNKPAVLSWLSAEEWRGLVDALSSESRKRIVSSLEIADELKVRVGKDSSNSSKPPSTDRPDQKDQRNKKRRKKGKKRRPGGQKGHPGHQRPLVPPERVDETISHFPEECRGCGESLIGVQPDPDPLHHQVAEIPEIRPTVTDHLLHSCECPICDTKTTASLPKGVSTSCFGPNLRAIIVLLSGRYRMARREVMAFCDEAFGLNISLGSVANVIARSSRALEAPFLEVARAVKAALVAHMDETGWREKGKQLYLWILATASCALFQIGRRTKEMAQSMLGKDFIGRLITDRYKAYFWILNKFHQICWAHLKRDFEDLVARGGKAKAIGKRLLGVEKDLFNVWHAYKDGHIGWKEMQRRMAKVEARMFRLLKEYSQSRSKPAAKLCKSLFEIKECLFVFSRFKDVEPTNNTGERGVRPAVQWRKTCFGTQSNGGSRFVERILTVVLTCRLQNRSLLSYLRDVLVAADAGEEIPSIFVETKEEAKSSTKLTPAAKKGTINKAG